MSIIDKEAVYAAVRAIPSGTVITYGDLAEGVGLTRSHARAVGRVLGNRPNNDAWMTETSEDHDIPWWRVVKADGTLLANEDEESRQWVDWARAMLVSEGVNFTNDGRVASLADGSSSRGTGGSSRSSRAKPARAAIPCWKHHRVQYSCRDCAPGR